MLNLATVLNEFHKAQCYFISAIEIAALVLSRQVYNAYRDQDPPKVFDLLLSFPLSMNGIVPITFSLLCISLYSRLTRHVLILSLVPIAISTGALASAYTWTLRIRDQFGDDLLSVSNAGSNWQFAPEVARMVCGSKSGNLENVISRSDIRFALIWVIYTFCVASFLWCVVTYALNSQPKGSYGQRIRMSLKYLTRKPPFDKILPCLGYPLLALVWALCFTYHFYLYSLFTKSHLVSSEWSFGQIIAVTVWIPSIIEYLYIECGKFP